MNIKKISSFVVLVIVLLSFIGCSNFKEVVYINELTQKNSTKNRLERITNLWVGHFSNKEQGANLGNQETIGRRIWQKKRVDEYWLYLGWFQKDSYESALSSNIARVTKISPDTAFITFYQIKDNVEVDPYEWRKDEPFSDLNRSDLKDCRAGCGSFIVKRNDGAYDVIAKGPCYGPISDKIKYYEVNAVLTSEQVSLSSRFLDEKFNLVMARENNTYYKLTRPELEVKYERINM